MLTKTHRSRRTLILTNNIDFFFQKILRWADTVESVGIDGKGPREFKHPFIQACAMFFGEFLCLVTFKLVYYSLRRRNVSLFFRRLKYDSSRFYHLKHYWFS